MSNVNRIINIIKDNRLVRIGDQITFNGFTFNSNYKCEPEEKFRENFQQYLWLVNIVEKKIIGVVDIGIDDSESNDYRYFIISYRCTFDKTGGIIASSGRLLWAYILNFCYIRNEEINSNLADNLKKKLIVYNFSTSDAIGYHIKMGMRSIQELEIPFNIASSLEGIRWEEHDERDRKLSTLSTDYKKPGFLFYIPNEEIINYNSIYDILVKNYEFEKKLESTSAFYTNWREYQKKYLKYKKKYLELKSKTQK